MKSLRRADSTGHAFVTPSVKAFWIVAALCLLAASSFAATPATNIFESAAWTTPETKIDRMVFKKLSKLGIQPAPCSDAVFVRRAFLDVIGTLPTAAEVREFIKDQDPKKREALIDRLLAREEYADCWAMKWSDLLRVKAEFPVNLWPNAAQAYHHWIRTSVRDNKPYDQFVREMLTANGSNFRVGPVNFYRAMQNKTPEGIATTVALTFMGTRTDSWPTNKMAGLTAFFSQVSYKPTREWKEEVVFWDPDKELNDAIAKAAAQAASNAAVQATVLSNALAAVKAATTNPVALTAARETLAKLTNSLPKAPTNAAAQVSQPIKPVRTGPLMAEFPDGKKINLTGDRDPREIFADWLITPKNPWFVKNIVNRQWSWLMGRGIIHEPDDIRPDNPPVNPDLLEFLQKEFVSSHYDMKHIFRLILTSRAYQLSSVTPASFKPEAAANFAFYPLRQLDAEVLIDAIDKITGSTELYTSAIPEPFTFIPENKPAIALPDGSITSSFLELFGRPARATGMENERINRPSAPQRMYLLNSIQIQRKIEESAGLKAMMAPTRKPHDIAEDLYLTILSRLPSDDEAKNAEAYAKGGVAKGREAWLDLAWALMNTDEFRLKH